jgi:hypothetical protein
MWSNARCSAPHHAASVAKRSERPARPPFYVLHLFNTKISQETTAMRFLQQQKMNGASWNTQLVSTVEKAFTQQKFLPRLPSLQFSKASLKSKSVAYNPFMVSKPKIL